MNIVTYHVEQETFPFIKINHILMLFDVEMKWVIAVMGEEALFTVCLTRGVCACQLV